MAYDSRQDTLNHIHRVRELLEDVRNEFEIRAILHDQSKLESPEKEAFDRLTPRLKTLEYGSPEYEESRRELGEALEHHYANNSHHPEHFENGVNGMTLFDVLEMLVDWKAASERHETGDISKSLTTNITRFNIDPQLQSILENTVKVFGWT